MHGAMQVIALHHVLEVSSENCHKNSIVFSRINFDKQAGRLAQDKGVAGFAISIADEKLTMVFKLVNSILAKFSCHFQNTVHDW